MALEQAAAGGRGAGVHLPEEVVAGVAGGWAGGLDPQPAGTTTQQKVFLQPLPFKAAGPLGRAGGGGARAGLPLELVREQGRLVFPWSLQWGRGLRRADAILGGGGKSTTCQQQHGRTAAHGRTRVGTPAVLRQPWGEGSP